MIKFGAAIGFALLISQNAFGYCSKPSAGIFFDFPEPSISRPNMPYCLSEFHYSRTHTCEEWEIQSYLSEVEDYQRQLERYLDEVNDFMDEAKDLADDAERYANCAMKEVMDELG